MKKFSFLIVLMLVVWVFVSCGPSAEERRQQEIEDSIKLEEDRRKLLERANTMFASPADTTQTLAEGDSL
ncbi:MAG: hypothetical protein ACK4VN_09975 [Bacteroidales bacterium]